LPMSDDPVRTRMTLAGGREVAFQEYFVGMRHSVAVTGVRFEGADVARPARGVIDILEAASTLVIAPSNPVVSIGPVLAVPGVKEVLVRRRSDVVAISPIVGGAALKGPADRLLVELGGEASVGGVARHLAGVAGTLVIDDVDAPFANDVEEAGVRAVVTGAVMSTREKAASLASAVLAAAGE
ncbi:MAG: 2-phospho-L-lactate transferase CofD family protein, partial [Acidimicrobiales bacterium]